MQKMARALGGRALQLGTIPFPSSPQPAEQASPPKAAAFPSRRAIFLTVHLHIQLDETNRAFAFRWSIKNAPQGAF